MKELTRLKYLIVEDSETDYLIISELFSELSISEDQLHWFTTIEAVKPAEYDIVLCDLNLPDSNRLNTIKLLKSKIKNTPLIALTGLSEPGLAVDTIQKGAQDFLVKGNFDAAELYKTIAFALEREELANQLAQFRKEYEDIFENNPLPHLVYNIDSLKILKANSAAVKLYGYSKQELCSKTIMDIRPKTEIEPTKKALSQFLKNGVSEPKTFIHLTKNNKEIHVEVTVQAYKKGDDNRVVAAIKDITYKVRADEELKMSELRFEYATMATSDIIYDWDLVNNKLEWKGKSIEKFYENNGPKNIQQWIAKIKPEDRQVFTNLTHDAITGRHFKKKWDTQYALKDRNGNYRQVQDRAIVLFDNNENPTRIIGALEDVTEKVRAIEKLALSEKKYNAFFYESPLPKLLCNANDLALIQKNKEAEILLQNLGGEHQSILDLFKEADRSTLSKIINGSVGNYSEPLGEWQLASANTYKNTVVQLTMHRLEVDGEQLIIFACNNITELENTKTELEGYIERYKLVMQATNEAIWDYEIETDKLVWADNFKDITGYEPSEVTFCSAWADYIHADDVSLFEESFNEAISNGSPKWKAEYRFKRRDGSYATVEDHCAFVRDKSGKALRAVGAMKDITEEAQRKQRLKLMEQVVEKANDPIIITEAEPIDEPGPKIVYVNDALIKQTGYTRDELIGQNPRMLQGPKSDRKELDKMRAAMEKWQPSQIGTLNYKKNGEEYWVEFSIVPIANDKGWFTHWISIQRETTEKARKREIRNAFRKMNIAVSRGDSLSERYASVLNEICAFTGYDVAEGWLTNIDNSQMNRAAVYDKGGNNGKFIQHSNSFTDVRKNEGLPGKVWSKKETLIWKNLAEHPEFIRNKAAKQAGIQTSVAIPIFRDESVVGVIVLFSQKKEIDLKENTDFLGQISFRFGAELQRLKAEGELQTIFDLSPNMLFVIDRTGKIKRANNTFLSTLGLTQAEIDKVLLKDFILEAKQSEFLDFLKKTIKSKSSIEIDIPIFSNNKLLWFNLVSVFVPSEGLVYCVAKDVTEQKDLEDLLDKAHKMARMGTWEVNLSKNKIYWSAITKKIHEVDEDYEPELETAINFYKEGESRNLVQKNVDEAIRGLIDGWEFDAELVTAKGNTLWVRAQGQVERVNGNVVRIYGSFQDIDDRKRTQESLAEAILRYDLASEAAHIGIWDWYVPKDKLVWDDTMMELYGVESKSFKGAYEAWQEGLHPDDRDEQNEKMQKALKGEGDFNTQFRIIRPKTGDVRHIKAFGYIKFDDDKRPLRVIGVNFDITEEVKQKERLEVANKEREDILESITDGFFSVDHNWTVTYWNMAAEKMLQRPRNEILGNNLWDVYDDAKGLKFYEEYHKCMSRNEVRRFVEYYPAKDIWVEVSSFPKDDGIVVYFKNITDRIRNEEELTELKLLQEHVINSTEDLIWAIDSEYNLLLANNAYMDEMREVSDREYEIGKPVISTTDLNWAFDQERKDLWTEKYRNSLKGNTQHFTIDVNGNAKKSRIYQISLYPIVDRESAKERIAGVACFAKNITERQNHITTIESQNEKLKNIAWTQSHVVRAPLARILGLAQLIEDKAIEEGQLNSILEHIVNSSHELDSIIREITTDVEELDLPVTKDGKTSLRLPNENVK